VDELPLEILMGKTRVVELLARERRRARRPRVARPARRPARAAEDAHVGAAAEGGLPGDHVYLTEDAAVYLVQAGLKLVGFDYLSIDRFGNSGFLAHHALLGAGVIVVEGLDLSEVEPGEYDMACLPLRVGGGDGAPGARRPSLARLTGRCWLMNVLLLRDVVAILLAGGAGERLYPLTRERAKPAVPFGGPYRIIDFTLSNCVNSGLRKIIIATQYKARA
jgi:hypothetical protein